MNTLLQPLPTAAALRHWIGLYCNVRVPVRSVCPRHDAPFEYLRRAYFEPASDQVVHAPRGGGKTRLAALATLLDLLHKPGAQVRILGGSLEQSLRMWEHLLPDLERLGGGLLLKKPGSARRVRTALPSSAAVLTQSQRAVRGLRVQKLRCDEVELFRPDVWEAAQLVTRSIKSGDGSIAGAVEALSTLHEPFGLMQRILDQAHANGTRVVRWCLLDVLERCPPHRDCASCPLWDECGGVAKVRCDGFFGIDDAIAMKRRVSLETWQCEMLCQRPSVRGAVFPNFDPRVHVTQTGMTDGGVLSLAIDFGFAAPLVCLWVRFDGVVTRVIDEYVQPRRTLDEHIEHIRSRSWGTPAYVACDPAGNGRNEQTATSSVQLLKRSGYVVRSRASRIIDGVEQIRTALRPAAGEPRLFIHPRCRHLTRAMQAYRHATLNDRPTELPLKDGEHDHLIDALRYHFVNRPTALEDPRRY